MLAVIANSKALSVTEVTTKKVFWQNKLLAREKPSFTETLKNYTLNSLSTQGRT
jgi:hypothetical protein